MSKLGVAFQKLECGTSKALVDLCPEVRDKPWDALSMSERETLLITYEFLKRLMGVGLVACDTPKGVTLLRSSIPHLKFRRLVVDGEQYITRVVESAIYALRQKETLRAYLKESA